MRRDAGCGRISRNRMMGPEILTVEQSAMADRLAEAAGIPSITLMENAGRAVSDAVMRHVPPAPVLVLCGPGNNGGDGLCAARHLRHHGYAVNLRSLVPPEGWKGDA